ncbi:MAG: ATP-binding protein [Anaerolineae bacterium]|nr:ATP-binding protein [Anaerolineae bacterium]
MPQLVVFSGLPGAGKSALAEAVGTALGIPVFAKDWLESVLLRHGIDHGLDPAGQPLPLGYVGYDLLTTLAARQLQLGQSVILDSVASTETIRTAWRDLARQYAVHWRVIECICADESLHRSRLGSRQRRIPNWPELTWADVERVKSYYAAWTEDHLIIDSVHPFETNLQIVLDYLTNIT